MIHEAIGHSLEADGIQKDFAGLCGESRDGGGERKITVYDDPTLPGHRGRFYDDEGTRSERTVLVDKGVLKNLSL